MIDPNIYLRKIRKLGPINVWLVDGAKIRQSLDEEFTNFGQHFRFKYIPENEFWIDKEAVPNERRFFIDHLLTEYKLMRQGASYNQAIDLADQKEKLERLRSQSVRKVIRKVNFPPPDSVHRRLLGKTSDGVSVWVVDGKIVRSVYFTDFTEGGHDLVYSFVSAREVWLDDDLLAKERPFVLVHELLERSLMAGGLSYNRAHAKASKLEWESRHSVKKMTRNLRLLGWKEE